MLLALRSRTGENLPTDHRLLAQMLATSGNKRRHVLSAVSQLGADGFLVLSNQRNGVGNSGAEKSRAEVDIYREVEVEESSATTTPYTGPSPCRGEPSQTPTNQEEDVSAL